MRNSKLIAILFGINERKRNHALYLQGLRVYTALSFSGKDLVYSGLYSYNDFMEKMNYHIDIQNVSQDPLPVANETLEHWVVRTLEPHQTRAELTLRFVDTAEMIELNHTYRKQNKVTNVLAFPATYPEEIELDYPLLGDIIICPKVLLDESQSFNTDLVAHWAHIVIHGVLHLLGYDHIIDTDELVMRQIEINLLHDLGYNNPYNPEDNILE